MCLGRERPTVRPGFGDLRSFTFLGPSGRLGAACDWVWFNVPQGPQKQIACFLHAYRTWRAGKGQARQCKLGICIPLFERAIANIMRCPKSRPPGLDGRFWVKE